MKMSSIPGPGSADLGSLERRRAINEKNKISMSSVLGPRNANLC